MNGHEILEIRNFGVFEVKSRDARMGRNPRTGEEVPITEKRVATFKPGKALKELVQSGIPMPEAPTEFPGPERPAPSTGTPPAQPPKDSGENRMPF